MKIVGMEFVCLDENSSYQGVSLRVVSNLTLMRMYLSGIFLTEGVSCIKDEDLLYWVMINESVNLGDDQAQVTINSTDSMLIGSVFLKGVSIEKLKEWDEHCRRKFWGQWLSEINASSYNGKLSSYKEWVEQNQFKEKIKKTNQVKLPANLEENWLNHEVPWKQELQTLFMNGLDRKKNDLGWIAPEFLE